MKKEERKHSLALTLLVSAIVFVMQLVAILIAAAIVYLLVHTGVLAWSTQDVTDPVRLILFMALISLVLGIMVIMLGSRYILKPVNRLVSQMNRLASGDYKARIHFGKPITSHPTFQEVADSFNTLARELDNTEMLRSDFINNFSHEFKTPIVSIAGFAKLLRRGNLAPQQQEEYLGVIEEESLRLANITTALLNMTKVENQTILTDVTEFNLSEQLRACILLLEDKWSKKDISFELQLEELSVNANEELLKQVWINLLDNAIKFSEPGGCVSISAAEEEEKLSVQLRNSGAGIPEESLGRVFQKFYQADESHSAEGSGIGLAIVKKVVQLHSGTIRAESKNGITSFTVLLPK